MQNENIEGFRLSPQQRHLWLLQQDSLAYRTQCVIRIEGKSNAKIIEKVLHRVVNKHGILRTNFKRNPSIKVPFQVISNDDNILYNINLIHLSVEEKSANIEEFYQKERRCIFNFEKGPLFRSSLLTLSENQRILFITIPSLCADSWSLKNLVQEISDTYGAYIRGEELSDEPVQYIQFSEWQNKLLEEEDVETKKAYWHEQEIQSLPVLNLPFEGKHSGQTRFEPDVHALRIAPNVVTQIEAIATLYNTTIAEFFFACWQILLWRLTGHSDIVISTVSSGRKYEELHEVLGLLAKWLPVHCPFQGNFKFTEVLSQISKTLLYNEKWQEYFLWEKSAKSPSEVASFPISFEFEEWLDKYNVGDVSFSVDKHYVCFEPFKVKLTCVRRAESVTAEFHYDPELINFEGVQYLAEHFLTLAESAANNPQATISKLEILSPHQQQQLLIALNHTHTDYPLDKFIHQLFEAQVEQIPNEIAVVFEEQQLTYYELNESANQLAHYLQRLGVGPEVLVGICLERSHLVVIALLAIFKAGGAYLPLDPALPLESLAFRLQDAQGRVLLTQQSLLETLPDSATQIVYLDKDWDVIAQESSTNPTSNVTIQNLVYVLFTSGSTGTPKGVAVEHRQLLNYLHALLDKLQLPVNAKFATVSTFAADLGNTVIFPALCTGGCLHIISQDLASNPAALGDYCNRHPIDCLKIVPSHLAALLATSQSQSILPRQRLILGGEAASWELIEQILRYNPDCQIFNHYGPTETTVGVLTYLVELPEKLSTHQQSTITSLLSREGTPAHEWLQNLKSSTVPLGRPLANTQVYVLDKQLQPVPTGVPGELYIGGAGLARGYLNRPDLTASAFIANPFNYEKGMRLYKTGDLVRYLSDGNLEFVGRVDNQVKIRGFRLELGEIEALLSQHAGVQQCVVSVWEEELGNKRLAAYIVPNKKPIPSVNDLRSFCSKKLPEYMVPGVFVMLKALPLTPNGKVDRRNLPAPEQVRPVLKEIFVAPRTDTEQTIAAIWQEMLHVEKVGINDNFFELGGHSLLLVQIHNKLQGVFQRDLSVSIRHLFENPTVAEQAKAIQHIQGEAENNSIKTIKRIERENVQQMLANLDQISDDEVDALFNQMIVEKDLAP